ncbi:MAG: hydrogenase expression/formation protein HypE [Armatimonadetes bacterium]|nr:hydrogenase expression/formation protein HypE [Armatimonadota bacterium]
MERTITLAHGSGGRLTSDLVREVFVATFADSAGQAMDDAAVLPAGEGRVALTTDAFVVKPRFFPGGDIGKLSICGTVNDLAVAGARPVALTTAFIIEEGVGIDELITIAASMATCAREAGVRLVAGDTKVVERGSGDGVYITTAGYGLVADGLQLSPTTLRPGDVLLVSGDVGRHEAAILLARGQISLAAPIVSDCGLLVATARAVLKAGGDGVRCLRDATRGGLATVLCEWAESSGCGLLVEDARVPVTASVSAVSELLGLDPLYLANEGRLVTAVAPERADAVEAALRALDPSAARIGRVSDAARSRVLCETGVGGRRVLDKLAGGQLPRIC